MTPQQIEQILTEAPSKISNYSFESLKHYEIMQNKHQEYKVAWATKYLAEKSLGDKTIKDIEAELEVNQELINIKNAELKAEIEYRSWRLKAEKARDLFDSAKEMGWNIRAELKGLGDTIKKEKEDGSSM